MRFMVKTFKKLCKIYLFLLSSALEVFRLHDTVIIFFLVTFDVFLTFFSIS